MTEGAAQPIVPLAPRSYSGLLDDAGMAYRPDDDRIGIDFFRRMIAKNIFFSGGLLLNDGYLVNHPAARRELMDDQSLLRTMINTDNFVRVLTRTPIGENIADMPQQMASTGNGSFADLVASDDWKALEPKLRRLSNVWDRGNRIIWPNRQLHVGFCQLIERALTHAVDNIGLSVAAAVDIEELREEFDRRAPLAGNSRHHFEQAAIVCVQSAIDGMRLRTEHRNLALHELMTLANQAYHYNFGMCLNEQSMEPIVVDTTVGAAFDELLQLDEIFEGTLDDVRILRIPKALPFDNGRAFIDLIDAATPVGEAKAAYLFYLDQLFALQSAPDRVALDNARRDFSEATKRYRARIAEHFGGIASKRWADSFEESVLSMGIGSLGAAAAGPIGGLAVELANNQYSPAKFLLRKMRIRELETELRDDIDPLEPLNYYQFTAAELLRRHEQIRPKFSSVAFNQDKISSHVAAVPLLSN